MLYQLHLRRKLWCIYSTPKESLQGVPNYAMQWSKVTDTGTVITKKRKIETLACKFSDYMSMREWSSWVRMPKESLQAGCPKPYHAMKQSHWYRDSNHHEKKNRDACLWHFRLRAWENGALVRAPKDSLQDVPNHTMQWSTLLVGTPRRER